MSRLRSSHLACALLLAAGSTLCSAAVSPWNGTWKLDEEKSKRTGATDVVNVAPDGKWTVTTSGLSINFSCDGKEYPFLDGHRSLTCNMSGASEVNLIIKAGNDELAQVKRTLSDGDKTMSVSETGKNADGSAFHDTEVFKKISSDPGWSGTWQNTKIQTSTHGVAIVNATEDSITFTYPMSKSSLTAKLDGTPTTEQGPHPDGVSISLKSSAPLTIQEVDSLNGVDLEHDTLSVTPDGKTMTVEVQRTDAKDKQVYVYDKQ